MHVRKQSWSHDLEEAGFMPLNAFFVVLFNAKSRNICSCKRILICRIITDVPPSCGSWTALHTLPHKKHTGLWFWIQAYNYILNNSSCFLHLVLCVCQKSLHGSLSSGLDDLLDVVVLGLQTKRQDIIIKPGQRNWGLVFNSAAGF